MNLTIKDLSASTELDQAALTAVRGGGDNGNSAVNSVGQLMNINVPVGVLSGGPSNTNVNVCGTQNASIYNDQIAGDSFLAVLPFGFGRV
jgi:hypothetical protein